MVYFKAKEKIKCKGCHGSGFSMVEGYEYICLDCKGMKHTLKDVLIDIETLAEKIGDKLKCKKIIK